jgi:hypothetical protein
MSFTVSNVALIERGALVATFEVTLDAEEFRDAVSFDAVLLLGPYGYFAVPAGIRDYARAMRTRTYLSRAFSKAICAIVKDTLRLKDPPPPDYDTDQGE